METERWAWSEKDGCRRARPGNEAAIANCGNSQRWFVMYGGTAYYTPSAGAAFTSKNGNLANYLNTDFDVRMVATLE